MRILVFSDSHNDIDICEAVINKLPPADMIIHAGDCFSDVRKLEEMYPNVCFKYVAGNCDGSHLVQDITFSAEGKTFFVSHGHGYGVKFDREYGVILEKAKEEHADVVVFGHTHESYCDTKDGILLLNPGSIKYERSFGIIEIEDGNVSADICDAELWL